MHGSVFISDAVNWASPLNRGLVSWWLALPGQQRGVKFRDLCRRNDGTLTNGPTWQGAKGRPGGWGALGFAGSTQHVAVPDHADLDLAGGSTIAFDVYINSYASLGTIVSKFAGLGGGTDNRGFRLEAASFYITEAATNRHNIVAAVPAGTWKRVTHTLTTGLASTAYVDGTLVSTSTFTGTWFNTALELRFGAPSAGFFGAGSGAFNGYLDNVKFFSRALSASDVAMEVYDSRAGYPTTLNWHRPRRYAFQDEGGGVTGSPWYYYQQLLAG